jgi:hypothetical protein
VTDWRDDSDPLASRNQQSKKRPDGQDGTALPLAQPARA